MTFEINLVSWVRWLFLTRIHLNQFIHFVLFTHKVHVLTADSSDSLLVFLSKCSFCAFTKPPADRDQQIYRRQRCRQPDWSCFFCLVRDVPDVLPVCPGCMRLSHTVNTLRLRVTLKWRNESRKWGDGWSWTSRITASLATTFFLTAHFDSGLSYLLDFTYNALQFNVPHLSIIAKHIQLIFVKKQPIIWMVAMPKVCLAVGWETIVNPLSNLFSGHEMSP